MIVAIGEIDCIAHRALMLHEVPNNIPLIDRVMLETDYKLSTLYSSIRYEILQIKIRTN